MTMGTRAETCRALEDLGIIAVIRLRDAAKDAWTALRTFG